MNRVRRPSLPSRLLLAAVVTLCLGVRLLTPPGFMPSFAGGSLAIIECPDARVELPPPPPAMAMHHMHGMAMPALDTPPARDHGKDGFHHQSCPYASAASLHGLTGGFVAPVEPFAATALPLAGHALPVVTRKATRERPPAQGPPVPA